MEVIQGNQEEVEVKEEVTVPDIIGKTIQDAEKILKENELEIYTNTELENVDKENTIVKSQTPQPGIVVYKKNRVYIDF